MNFKFKEGEIVEFIYRSQQFRVKILQTYGTVYNVEYLIESILIFPDSKTTVKPGHTGTWSNHSLNHRGRLFNKSKLQWREW